MSWQHSSAKSQVRLIAIIGFAGFVALGAPTVHGNPLAVVAFVTLWVGLFVRYAYVRCPRCQHLLMFRRRHQFLGWLPRHCPDCGLSTSSARPSYGL
jgi:hypothetical protein